VRHLLAARSISTAHRSRFSRLCQDENPKLFFGVISSVQSVAALAVIFKSDFHKPNRSPYKVCG
jgi:hypothetical protein